MESVAVVGSGPHAAHWVRLCLASGFEVLFLRKKGPISRVFEALSRLEAPDLVLVVGEDTTASWITALESRMSAGAVLATTFVAPPWMIECTARPDQLISIVEEKGRLSPCPHPRTAIGVTMATALFLERVSEAWEQLTASRRRAPLTRPPQHHMPG
jgi:hypothetical protein